MTKQDWENNLDKFPEANFLQSWAWGEFHLKLNHPVYRISFDQGMFQIIVEPAKRGRYLTVPGGPLLKDYFSSSQWKQAVSLMKEIALKEKCSFVRIRPQAGNSDALASVIKQNGFRPAPMHLHAQLTRILDLSLSDDELLRQMRKSTRYEIKKAGKMGIIVEKSQDESLIDDFIRLQTKTAKREGFVPFSRKFLSEQFKAFKNENAVKFFYVKRPGLPREGQALSRILSMAIAIFCRKEAVYHYAASGDEARKTPAAYAIQWAIIQEAKKLGMKTYNLWGDVEDDKLSACWRTHRFAMYQPAHRFAGPSLFKRGFGGGQFSYFPAHDLPLSWKYWINWGIENIRKLSRSL
ncbi:peptidoglycan bridge formation glycyltransferase FemA/FemB family protein [Candidatus Collierbacteria bacterium]|nr:peptidoglycan bridge formation glycyltransferase FemA/FemB family protein [Candidatus Collierbacteria bacterium]